MWVQYLSLQNAVNESHCAIYTYIASWWITICQNLSNHMWLVVTISVDRTLEKKAFQHSICKQTPWQFL